VDAKVDFMSDDLAVSRIGAIVAGVAASAGAAFTVAWWIDPAFADAAGDPVMLVGFLFVMGGLGTVIALGSDRGRGFLRSCLSTPWTVTPLAVRTWLALVVAASALSAAVALPAMGGYSQNSPGEIPTCKWSLVKDHGRTNICVNHARWLATGHEFQRVFVGFLAIMLSIECASLTTISRIPVRKLSAQPHTAV
jgi:hypothetical protein